MNSRVVSVGKFCGEFRKEVLKMTLEEIADGTNIKTLSGFENGRSSNIVHTKNYISKCVTHEQKMVFITGMLKAIERGSENG